MSIAVTCDQCSKVYEVSEKGAGRKFRCKGCSNVLTVPDATASSAGSTPSLKKTGTASSAGESPTLPARPRAATPKPSTDQRSRSASRSTEGSSKAEARSRAEGQSKAGARTNSESTTADGTAARSVKKKTARSSSGSDSASGVRKKKSPAKAAGAGAGVAASAARKKKRSAKDYELFDGDFDDDAAVDDGDYDDYAADDYDHEDYEADDDGYEDYQPAPRRSTPAKKKSQKGKKAKKSGGGSPLSGLATTFNINRLNLALVIFGGMGIFFGINEARLSAQSSSEPTTISLPDLIANGPGGNIYLTVTGSEADLDETVIYYTEDRQGNVRDIDEAFIPMKPRGATSSAPVKLIVYSTKSTTEMAVAGIASQGQHTGLLVNDILSISGEKRQMLDTVPGLDIDTAYILHERRTPSGAFLVVLYFLGGGVLLLGGLFWMFFVHG